ncbi:MAG: STAS domain-containing protein [Coriobacteriales bacterium]|nr:STAS domain-containing protein [Coriobacteriales bacterium]
MEIVTKHEGSTDTIAVFGKLTVTSAPKLEEAVAALGPCACDVVFDLAALEYIASAGLRVLVGTQLKLGETGGKLRILHPNDEVMEVFEMTGLVDVLTIER